MTSKCANVNFFSGLLSVSPLFLQNGPIAECEYSPVGGQRPAAAARSSIEFGSNHRVGGFRRIRLPGRHHHDNCGPGSEVCYVAPLLLRAREEEEANVGGSATTSSTST